jgi:hypothetical protein
LAENMDIVEYEYPAELESLYHGLGVSDAETGADSFVTFACCDGGVGGSGFCVGTVRLELW